MNLLVDNDDGVAQGNVSIVDTGRSNRWRKFVERHLFVENKRFLITPNGGTGDCMFKAVCQAIEGSEVNHIKIREEVVHFVVNHRWDKLKESIEVQHVQGNQSLQRRWAKHPTDAYINYMNACGTLGSASELNAAGELFHYNFVTIQEYSDQDKTSYRVENCCPFDDPSAPFHYFFFTGDFDNGHWEYLEPLEGCSMTETISDGLYTGEMKVFIEGVETLFEEWLKIHTENTNDVFRIKHSVARFASKKSPDPFEWDAFKYDQSGCVLLDGLLFSVTKCPGTDLFTMLSAIIYPEVKHHSEDAVDSLEDKIISYRLDKIETLNYKLITQPHSHGFDMGTLKYLAMPCKGNIQDLLSTADIFGFSFQIFMKTSDDQDVRSCRFVHVDRWGGETDRMLHFFMRLCPGTRPEEEVVAKWWHVVPQTGQHLKMDKNTNKNFMRDANEIGDFSTRHPTSQSKTKAGDYSSRRPFICKEQEENPSETVSESGDDGSEGKKFTKLASPDPAQSPNYADKEASEASSPEKKKKRKKSKRYRKHSKREKAGGKTSSESSFDNLRKKSRIREFRRHESNPKPRNFSTHHKRSSVRESHSFTQTKQDPCKKKEDSKVKEEKFRTVVEVYDDVTNKRKEYVFHGKKTKEEVLQTLYERGYIKNVNPKKSQSHSQEKSYIVELETKPEDDSKPETENVHTISNIDESIDPRPRTPISEIVTMKSLPVVEEDVNLNQEDKAIKSTSRISLVTRPKSASTVALTNQDSVENNGKFLALHQRLSPWSRKGEEEMIQPKSWANRFISWISSLLNKCRKHKIDPHHRESSA